MLVRSVTASKRTAGAANTSEAAMTSVVVAALPIERGADLTPAMLKVVSYTRDAVPAGAFHTVDQLTGKTAQRSMVANEPVLSAKLSGAGGGANLSGVLDPGMRAVSVRSSDVAGVGGFVLPGDRVDVLTTRTVGVGDAASTVTQVLAENALVLGVDQSSDQEADKPVVAKAVTIEVTPDQAQAISLGQIVGQVSLTLRQISDHSALGRKATTVADLGNFGAGRKAGSDGRPKVAAKPKLPPGFTEVRVTRGVETSGYPVGAY